MSEASRTNEAERVEFSRPSLLRLNAYSARKEGRTDPQANSVCEWVGSPLKRHRKMPWAVTHRNYFSFISRHFQPAVKRSKTTLLRALPIKLAVQVFRMSEASRTNEAERVEFSRPSLLRLNAYSARKEGRTDPQANSVCEWVGSPLKRHRKMPWAVTHRNYFSFISRHFQSAVKRSAHSITRLICGAPPC